MAQNYNDLKEAFEFGSTYPIPSSSSQQVGTTVSGVPTSNLQQLVSQTLQGVLGRSFKPGDHESFKAALNVSFQVEQVSGKDVYKHIPRAYPAVGATDIGAGISGAQYSLVTFAKGLHQQTQPLLKTLHSLNASVDQEEFGAAKAIFTTAWDEFVAELSREGGPRASRADQLADSIFNVDGLGHLTELGKQLGVIKEVVQGKIVFDRSKVVTKEEEGHLTNFIALSDYYFATAAAWKNYRTTFLGKDLGSGLLLIERALAVVNAGVNEVYAAMDSVNIDQHERLILLIGFAAPHDQLTVEDFLSWVASFASREAPGLISEGGLRGVKAIVPTANTLKTLTGNFIAAINSSTTVLPKQFRHSRVLNPLSELERYLGALAAQATSMTT